ncbi:MAG: hypothetical protein ACLRWP_08340 [Bilophila wadsworthia]
MRSTPRPRRRNATCPTRATLRSWPATTGWDSHEYAQRHQIDPRSDPTALYYLACLLEGGEDPRFICRRPSRPPPKTGCRLQALPLAVGQQAVEFVGMPEGYIPLAETVYLALARKSNSTYAAYANAAREVKVNGPQSVPLHLRNASTQLQREWGYGKDYKYPHNFPQAWVEQDYLPPSVRNRVFYQPKEYGEEPRLASWSKRLKRTKPENR